MYNRFHEACLNIARGRRPRARTDPQKMTKLHFWFLLLIIHIMFLHVFVLFLWVKSTAIWKKLKKESKKEKSNTENDHFSFFSGHLEKWPQQEVHPKISNVTHQYCILGTPRLQKNIGSLRCGGGARWTYLATRLIFTNKFYWWMQTLQKCK